jgi:protein-disulfide isomerase
MSAVVSKVVSAAATGALVVCALLVTGLTVRREFGHSGSDPASRAAADGVEQRDWLAFAGEGHPVGPSGAPVVMVLFSDFQCPACRTMEQRIVGVRKQVAQPFTVVFRHLPLPIHPMAPAAAQAAECAGLQGRFEPMKNALFHNQPVLGVAEWKEIAREATVPDLAEFDRCRSSGGGAARIRADSIAAARLNAKGTPTVLIDGRRYDGTPSQAQLQSLIEEALRRSR